MSETFKPTSGLIFTYGGEMGEFVNLQWSGLEVFATVPLKSLLEFANSIERRECGPVEAGCANCGFSLARHNGDDLICPDGSGLAWYSSHSDSTESPEAPLSERD